MAKKLLLSVVAVRRIADFSRYRRIVTAEVLCYSASPSCDQKKFVAIIITKPKRPKIKRQWCQREKFFLTTVIGFFVRHWVQHILWQENQIQSAQSGWCDLDPGGCTRNKKDATSQRFIHSFLIALKACRGHIYLLCQCLSVFFFSNGGMIILVSKRPLKNKYVISQQITLVSYWCLMRVGFVSRAVCKLLTLFGVHKMRK